jgi:predicted RNA polymerase sigma factor
MPETVLGPTETEELVRQHALRVLARLVRRYGGFDACEDAMQEALVAATVQWRCTACWSTCHPDPSSV